MALNKKFFPKVSAAADTFTPSEHFNTVLYTGNGGTQRIGGYINRGAVLNGSSSGITLPKTILNNGALKTFSISLWFQTSTTSEQMLVSTSASSSNAGINLNLQSNGYLIFQMSDGSSNTGYMQHQTDMSDGDWHHVVVTYSSAGGSNDATTSFYLDGTDITSSVASGNSWSQGSGSTFSSISHLALGRWPASSLYYLNGKLDQVRFFNKALSSTEVTTLYNETHASTTISTTDIFDDNSGVALYQLDGNANDTGGVSGYIGAGAIFNGSSSGINLGSTNQFASSTVSISFWVNPATISNNYVLLGNGNGGSFADGDNDIFLRSDGYIGYELGQSSSIYEAKYATTTQLTANAWNNVILTYDSSLGTNITKVYVNGVEQSLSATYTAGGTFSGDVFIGTLDYHIGKRNLSTLFFDGIIDEVKIYSDVLTSTEVGYIYNNTTASIPTDNLTAYYKLDGDARDEQQLYDGAATNVTYAYDGTASNVTYQEATNFTPDLVWIKSRSHATSHELHDSVRGEPSRISTDSTAADPGNANGFVSLIANGFTLDGTGSGGEVNTSGRTYVAWCFNAGTDAAVSNTDGDITSTVKANTDAGFSIVSTTNMPSGVQTFGHGLDNPDLVITKKTNASVYWTVKYHIGSQWYQLKLNTNDAATTLSSSLSPTQYLLQEEYATGTNLINYVFKDITGYQKIGTYNGTGALGNMVETGFEPAWLMIKSTGVENWYIMDNKRLNGFYSDQLYANLSNSEGSGQHVRFLSNGFKLDTTDGGVNNGSASYIYLAIAADPDTTTPTVENSFDVVTYTGNGGTLSIDTDFKPDLIWAKSRDASHHHVLVDSVRGSDGLYGRLFSSTTGAENTTSTDTVTNISTDGFTVNSAGSGSYVNDSSTDYVAWVWKAGDHDDNLPQINTEGSSGGSTLESIVSVNDEAGFSIVKYTGTGSVATIGHGLTNPPELIFVKTLDSIDNWMVLSTAVGATKKASLNATNEFDTDSAPWNDTAPTSTVFTVGTKDATNKSGDEFIAYCWYSVAEYSKIGTYNGTGGANTINTGFAPRFLLIKRTDSSGSWRLYDRARDTGSLPTRIDYNLNADTSGAEYNASSETYGYSNFTSTGFSFVSGQNNSDINADGGTYIYMAFK